jgi:toxin ParE1/3/4
MKRLIVSPHARADLKSIRLTIARDRPTIAAKQITAIRKRFKLFCEFPLVGELVERFGPGVRRFTVGIYVIYFRPSAETVDILRVLHGAQDAESQF